MRFIPKSTHGHSNLFPHVQRLSRTEAGKYANNSRSSVLRTRSVAIDTGAYDIRCQADCAEARRKYQTEIGGASVNWVLFQS